MLLFRDYFLRLFPEISVLGGVRFIFASKVASAEFTQPDREADNFVSKLFKFRAFDESLFTFLKGPHAVDNSCINAV